MPINAIYAAIPNLTRPVLALLTERMIERMDELDGDPDLELAGDEEDGSMGEDDFHLQTDWRGAAGCPISDPPEDDTEDCCTAGDDQIASGVGVRTPMHSRNPLGIGSDDDAAEEGTLPPRGAHKSREAHCGRIRRTRCRPVYHRYRWNCLATRGALEIDHYELITEPRGTSWRALRRRHVQLRPKRRRR